MAVITITKENFEAEVLKSAQPVLLDSGPPGAAPAGC